MNNSPVALITGGAQRIGAEIARSLHRAGYRVLVSYRHSATQAQALCRTLNETIADSAHALAADFDQPNCAQQLAQQAIATFGRLDALVNNASTFYPTPLGKASEDDWEALFNSNLKVPFFLCQALAPALADRQGAIVNLVDIHAERPLAQHSLYCMAKAGVAMMTRSLARELGPAVRVNGVSPGAILWPEQGQVLDQQQQQSILKKVPLARTGEPADIARTVLFLLRDAPYISGQIIAVDGGRSLNM